MAEVLGAIGFCVGTFGFILGTVPNAVKFVHTYKEQGQQISGFRHRVAVCESKLSLWETHWRPASLKGHEDLIQFCVNDLQNLNVEMQNAVQTEADGLEWAAWERMKDRLRRGIFRKPRVDCAHSPNFGQSIRHALFQKDTLEGWVGRLEKGIETIEKSTTALLISSVLHRLSSKRRNSSSWKYSHRP
jgi:hypothetical protein